MNKLDKVREFSKLLNEYGMLRERAGGIEPDGDVVEERYKAETHFKASALEARILKVFADLVEDDQ